MKKLPIGISDFREMIERKKYEAELLEAGVERIHNKAGDSF